MINKVLILYWSATGNTKKVSDSIYEGLKRGGAADITTHEIRDDLDVNYFDYDLICLGFPSYHWTTPEPVTKFLKAQFRKNKREGRVVPGAPVNGKQLLLYCTYCGTHTGMREAVPAVKYAGQFFEHVGFTIADEWYFLGEYVGNEPNSTLGRMGDIRGLPDEASLARAETQAFNLVKRL